MTAILLSIIAAPLVLIFCLWFSAKLITTPWQTAPEAWIRLLYWLALRLQAAAEACDSGLNIYRDTISRPIKPHNEQVRELRQVAVRNLREETALIERVKNGIYPI